ncbi:MAG: tyrosine--tRNA ligase [Oscillospiraceae bacterium]|jgi:tyrosyl-tRNA synthetase|nr:tyrosine--tRNA ligase [Oscillospiraceae bacterium]
MTLFQELKARGLIAQMTDTEETIEALLEGPPVKFYVGFDPTADSLHIGHFVQAIVMKHLQRKGHYPVALFGGATAMIGDPSGRTDMRRMLTAEEINHNIACFVKQMEPLVDFAEGKGKIVNNADWLSQMKFIDYMRDIGVHFSVNRMLAAECYKKRLEEGLTFFEMGYMTMQSYDFLHLNRTEGVVLEVGGDDQWSNMIGGVELIRRVDAVTRSEEERAAAPKAAYCMTSNLLLTSQGVKMGKTAGNAVWLSAEKTSPYAFFQYWRNIDDADVIHTMKMMTFLPLEQIAAYEQLEGSALNDVKELLAYEITKSVHGEVEAAKAREAARALFGGGAAGADAPECKLDFSGGAVEILTALTASALAKSKSEARRLIDQGSVTADGEKVTTYDFAFTQEALAAKPVLLKKGKKAFVRLTA